MRFISNVMILFTNIWIEHGMSSSKVRKQKRRPLNSPRPGDQQTSLHRFRRVRTSGPEEDKVKGVSPHTQTEKHRSLSVR